MNNSAKIMTLLKEPLLHFLLIGAALFFLYGRNSDPAPTQGGQAGTTAAQIVLPQADIDQMIAQFGKIWQRPPTDEEKKAIVEDLIRNEIYYREAVAIGLDRGDEVLKRRLRQKMEFILEDISSWTEPTDEELMAFMKKHRDKYLVDPLIAFRQVYVSAYKRGKSADADARQMLALLVKGGDPDSVGDTTMLESEIRLAPVGEIGKQFGEEFARSLLGLKPGVWAGPVRSPYGLHLVFVKERRSGRLADLEEVREAVKRDWVVLRQKELKDAAYAKIRGRYTVTVEGPRSTPVAATTKAATR